MIAQSDPVITTIQAQPAKTYGDFKENRARQLDLGLNAKGTTSIRDFGGIFLVHGKYLLESATQLKVDFASMVDLNRTSEFEAGVEAAKRAVPGLEVEFIQSDFRSRALYDRLRPVDTSFLFQVLLHQENYVSVIGEVCRTTLKYICVTQPCLREEFFNYPGGAYLLQFWPEDLKDKIREGAWWPREQPTDFFSVDRWIWGQSTSNLIGCFKGFGWDLEFGQIVEGILGPYWDFPLLRFRKR